MGKNGVWCVDDEVAIAPMSHIERILREQAERGLRAASMIERKSSASMHSTIPTFKDEIGC